MSRLSAATPILDAADRWKRQCLLNGGSLFDREDLWITQYFAELRRYFVDRPEKSSSSFEEKLRDQLEPATPQATRLWAEITWLYYLIVTSVKPVTKLDRIRRVYQWSGAALSEDHWALREDVLGGGMVHPGIGFHAQQWREFSFIVTLMCDWTSRSPRERLTVLQDPWEFAQWVDAHPNGHGRQFRHALLFLLFPDQFESSMSTAHKRTIVKAFGPKNADLSQVDRLDRIGLDKALLATRARLQDAHPDREIDFFKEPFRDVLHDPSPPTPDDHADRVDDEAWYRDRFGAADVWAIAPGEGARLWEDFLEHGIAAIGWDFLGDLGEYATRDDLHSALIKNGAGDNPWNQSLATWEFSRKMKTGDIVLARRGRRGILGWGEVTGNYVHDSDRSEYPNTRSVTWHPCRPPIELDHPTTTKTLTNFTPYKDLLRDVFARIDDPVRLPIDPPPPFGTADALSELFLEETQLSRILDSISIRKNLILQGPPGVGKTYISRRIAWCLTGYRDAPSIEMVQFHQSYAYEDFVQGWRPTESGGFTLRNGPFFEFCKRAEERPDVRFVFIIDEINRGNLSRIFGELLMLIEADKRGPEHAIALTYSTSGERFSVPANVYILGLMNTADRSLAIVDYALRRRFAFETLIPAYRTAKFREHLLEADVDRRLVDRIQNNLDAANVRIRENKDLGPGFEIGHSYFVPDTSADENWYSTVIETQIAPLLHEYWFDQPEKAQELIETLRQ